MSGLDLLPFQTQLAILFSDFPKTYKMYVFHTFIFFHESLLELPVISMNLGYSICQQDPTKSEFRYMHYCKCNILVWEVMHIVLRDVYVELEGRGGGVIGESDALNY